MGQTTPHQISWYVSCASYPFNTSDIPNISLAALASEEQEEQHESNMNGSAMDFDGSSFDFDSPSSPSSFDYYNLGTIPTIPSSKSKPAHSSVSSSRPVGSETQETPSKKSIQRIQEEQRHFPMAEIGTLRATPGNQGALGPLSLGSSNQGSPRRLEDSYSDPKHNGDLEIEYDGIYSNGYTRNQNTLTSFF